MRRSDTQPQYSVARTCSSNRAALCSQAFSQEALEFQTRIAVKSGLEWGKTALPPALWADPPDISMANARDEAEMVMYPVVEAALKKTGGFRSIYPFDVLCNEGDTEGIA